MGNMFEQGTLLWYWYDGWMVVGAFAVMLTLTLFVLARTSWSRVATLAMKSVVVVSTVLVGLAAADRVGASLAFANPVAFGYGTITAAIVTIAIGIATLGRTRSEPDAGAANPGPGVTVGVGNQPTMASGPGSDFTVPAHVSTPEEPGTAGMSGRTGPAWAEMAPQTGSGRPVAGVGPTPDRSTRSTPAGISVREPATAAAMGAGTDRVAQPAAPTAWLVQLGAAGMAQSYGISGDAVTVGRSSDNTVRLVDPTVSRHHCRITRRGDAYHIEDLGSSAGTVVDGTSIGQPTLLRPGSVLRLGETELRFQGPAATGYEGTGTAPAGDTGTVLLGGSRQALAWLLVRGGPHAGSSFPVSGERVVIGRGPECGVRPDDPAVSTQHAVIIASQGGFVLRDIGSRGGTTVNRKPLGGRQLEEGSRITIGSSELVFSELSGVHAPSAGAAGETAVLRPQGRGALLVRSGPSAGQSFALGERDLVVGREPGDGGARLDDPAASRRHALLRRNSGRYEVLDLGSANGTYVDGALVEGRELHNGDLIQVGGTELQFITTEG